jgi:hypothetical protein
MCWLFPRQNGFYDVWCQQRQPNDTAHERRPDAFRLGDFVQTPIGAVLQQFLPAKCPRDALIMVLSMVAIGTGLP